MDLKEQVLGGVVYFSLDGGGQDGRYRILIGGSARCSFCLDQAMADSWLVLVSGCGTRLLVPVVDAGAQVVVLAFRVK